MVSPTLSDVGAPVVKPHVPPFTCHGATVNAGVCPGAIVTLPNTTSTDDTGALGGTTTISIEADSPSLDAVIVAIPWPVPIKTPDVDTATIDESVLVHEITRSVSAFPESSIVIADMGYVSPSPIVNSLGTSSFTAVTATASRTTT